MLGNGGDKWVIDSVLVGCLCFGGASFMLRACTFDALLVHVGRVLVGVCEGVVSVEFGGVDEEYAEEY